MPLPLRAISWRLPALSSESGWALIRNGVNGAVMHRLFVALRPPRAMRERLLATMAGVSGARWQEDEQLHLTLRFVGEVNRHLAEDFAAALGSVRHPPIAVSLDRVGSFMRGSRGTMWAGVAPHNALRSLHRSVEGACRLAGLPPESRSFHPHITLARLSRGAGSPTPFLERWAGLTSPPVVIDSMILFESRLRSAGATYTSMARYPLVG